MDEQRTTDHQDAGTAAHIQYSNKSKRWSTTKWWECFANRRQYDEMNYGNSYRALILIWILIIENEEMSLQEMTYSDNDSYATHITSSSKHHNPRLNLLWDNLRRAWTNNEFVLPWAESSQNFADPLAKVKSDVEELLFQSLRGPILIPTQ